MYFDYLNGMTQLRNTYESDPKSLVVPANHNNIIGIEGCLWTEFVLDSQKVYFNLYPRLCDLTEAAWTNKEARDYEDFIGRLNERYKNYEF